MKLSGPYRLLVEGNTDNWFKAGGASTNIIGYLWERGFKGEESALETGLSQWGITVTKLDDDELEVPIYPQDQFAAVLDAEPTPEMIEAGWQVLDAEGVPALEVEIMQALFRAMERAR